MSVVLIVENEIFVANVIAKHIKKKNFTVCSTQSSKEALILLSIENPLIVVIDNNIIEFDELIEGVKSYNKKIKVIIITSNGNIRTAVKAIKMGAFDYLERQKDLEKISSVVESAYNEIKIQNQISEHKLNKPLSRLDVELIGSSKEIEQIKKVIKIIAPNNLSVFLDGKTGTGKSVVAKLIHNYSNRSDKNYIAVDCGAIPESLFESEMFGHERGSFTGAANKHIGYFERANGGTIFLDEISNLNLNLQIKLLRVIQERQISKIGSESPINIDVRIISASNKNLLELIKDDKFKDDLYYRINEICISIPSLKDRKEDIVLFANHFLFLINKELSKSIKSISVEAVSLLLEHDWPGNVRELINVIKKAVVFETTETLQARYIYILRDGEFKKIDKTVTYNMTKKVSEYKRLLVNNALIISDNNKTDAAKLLGISRRQMYRYI